MPRNRNSYLSAACLEEIPSSDEATSRDSQHKERGVNSAANAGADHSTSEKMKEIDVEYVDDEEMAAIEEALSQAYQGSSQAQSRVMPKFMRKGGEQTAEDTPRRHWIIDLEGSDDEADPAPSSSFTQGTSPKPSAMGPSQRSSHRTVNSPLSAARSSASRHTSQHESVHALQVRSSSKHSAPEDVHQTHTPPSRCAPTQSKQSPSEPGAAGSRHANEKLSAPSSTGAQSSSAPPAGKSRQSASGGVELDRLPETLREALMPFQREGIKFCLSKNGKAMIGDDMGLGKTIQAIALAVLYRDDWPVLCLMPASMRFVWADELEKWISFLRPGDVKVVRASTDTDNIDSAKFVLVTYDLYTRSETLQQAIARVHPGVLIVDESHYMKNKSAKRTGSVSAAAAVSKRVILLSGTPALNRPAELHPQISMISPVLGTWTSYTQRYCEARRGRFGWECKGAAHLDELNAKLKTVMIRRLKSDVLDQLPPKRRQQIPLELDSKFIATMKQDMDKMSALSDKFERNKVWSDLVQRTAVAKISAAGDYVSNLVEGGAKLLVFGHYIAVLDGLEQRMTRDHVKYVRIDGSVTHADRKEAVRRFQNDDDVRVAILGMLAAGQGFTLCAANTVVFAELHVTPGILVQCEDRAHRIGQPSSVNVHFLVSTGTIDENIWKMVSRKLDVTSRALDGTGQKMGAEEMESVVASSEEPPPELFELCRSASQTRDIRSFFGGAGKGPPSASKTKEATSSITSPSGNSSHTPVQDKYASAATASRVCRGPGEGAVVDLTMDECSEGVQSAWNSAPETKGSAKRNSGRRNDAGSQLRGEERRRLDLDDVESCSENCNNEDDQEEEESQEGGIAQPRKRQDEPEVVRETGGSSDDGRWSGGGWKHNKRGARMTDAGIKHDDGRWNAARRDDGHHHDSGEGDCVDLTIPKDQQSERGASGAERGLPRSSCPEEEENSSACERTYPHSGRQKLFFSVSGNTHRAYVFRDAEGDDCLGNVLLEHLTQGQMPAWMTQDDDVKKIVLKFSGEWSRLRAVQRKTLADRVVCLPLSRAVADIERGGEAEGWSSQRHSREMRFDTDMGLCGWCGSEVKSAPDSEPSRFCSHACTEKFQASAGSAAVRRQLYELERGVCQMCGQDAHELFLKIKALPKGPERMRALMESKMSLKGRMDKIMKSPQEGDFWQADHIRPVCLGGGLADISGFRTLCTPCHQEETNKLMHAVKKAKIAEAAKDSADIRCFFSKK